MKVESLEGTTNAIDTGFQLRIVNDALLHFLEAVDHRRVITASEGISDFDELSSEKLTGQVHGNLTRRCQGLGPGPSTVTPHSLATACWIEKMVSEAVSLWSSPSMARSLSRSASRATSRVMSLCLRDA